MIYCERTDENKYAIKDISETEIAALNSLLNGTNHPDLKNIRRAIFSEFGLANDKILANQFQTIEQCGKCQGSGFLKHEHPNSDLNSIENCHHCNGEGGRVKITSVRYEPLTENIRKRFAP